MIAVTAEAVLCIIGITEEEVISTPHCATHSNCFYLRWTVTVTERGMYNITMSRVSAECRELETAPVSTEVRSNYDHYTGPLLHLARPSVTSQQQWSRNSATLRYSCQRTLAKLAYIFKSAHLVMIFALAWGTNLLCLCAHLVS